MEEPGPNSAAETQPFKMPELPAMLPPSKTAARPAEKKSDQQQPLEALKAEATDSSDIQSDRTEGEMKESEPAAPTPRLRASPAELAKANQIPLPYQEPSWGGVPGHPYSLEVIKNGSQVETIPLRDKTFFVVGRLANCDIVLEHPSLSRLGRWY